MVDLRASTQHDNSAITFKIDGGNMQKNFFTDMISSYSSIDYLKGGKFIISRDFLTVKVWDVCNTKKPVMTVTVQDTLKAKLS